MKRISTPGDRFLAALVLTEAAQRFEKAAEDCLKNGKPIGAAAMRETAESYRRVIKDLTAMTEEDDDKPLRWIRDSLIEDEK